MIGFQTPKKAKLDTENPTHRLLLIADLVDMLLVSKISDLQMALKSFEVKLPDAELLKALKLLAFFRLVRAEWRGNELFWVRHEKSEAPWMDYTGKSGERLVGLALR